MGNKTDRQDRLLSIIRSQGKLPYKTLASMLRVSEMTVRRDIEELQNRAKDNSADWMEQATDSYNLMQALEKANEPKTRIGEFAASLILPNDVVIIDTGSTTARLLPHIPQNMDLTVLCFNANVLLELRYKPGIQLLFCGGQYHPNTEMFESPEGIAFIQRTRANKVFLSAAGVHETLGITCANGYEIPTKNAIINCSSERILIADSSKFGKLRSSYFCGLSQVETIVTDSNLKPEWVETIMGMGIALHLV